MITQEAKKVEYVLQIRVDWDVDAVGTSFSTKVYESSFSNYYSASNIYHVLDEIIKGTPIESFATRLFDYFDSPEISSIFGKNGYWPVKSLVFVPKIIKRTTVTEVNEESYYCND